MANVNSFDHINLVADGDTETAVYICIKGYTPSAGGSGHVEPGNYELEITRAAWVTRKSGQGRNLHLVTKTVGPEKFAGVPIMTWKPADDGGEKKLGLQWYQGLAYALAAHAGKLEVAQNAESIPLSPKNLVGRKFYANLRNGKEDFAGRSEIGRFITREEYQASPGPSGSVESFTPQMSTPQTSRPEIITGNGASKVDAAMPF